MKILLLGKDGQLGFELTRSLKILGELISLGKSECDVSNKSELISHIRNHSPNIIINAAAYTNVDKAELQETQAYAVNSNSLETISKEASKIDCLLIHFSTDYVFDGIKETKYNETDIPNPISIYAKSKYEGEKQVKQNSKKYLILRTGWIASPHRENFIKKIMKSAQLRDKINVVNDQLGSPISSETIADITAYIISQYVSNNTKFPYGTYNISSEGVTNWHEYAQYIVKTLKKMNQDVILESNNIKTISTEQYNAAAIRPLNSSLDNTLVKKTFGIQLPYWQDEVRRIISLIIENQQFTQSSITILKKRTPKISIVGYSGWWGRGMLKRLKNKEYQLSLYNSKDIIASITKSNTDLVYDCTGDPDVGRDIADHCLENNLNLMTINSEFECHYGYKYTQLFNDRGLTIEGSLGDQPGCLTELNIAVKNLGFDPVLSGICKGFMDKYQDPTGIAPFLPEGQNPLMISSFADGTKLNIEAATVCNYIDAYPDCRGMHGATFSKDELVTKYIDLLSKNNVVDYTMGIDGINQGGGVFVVAKLQDELQSSINDLNYMKIGQGPFYLFFRDYHLCYFEAERSIQNHFNHQVSNLVSQTRNADVISIAKKTLKKGDVLDGIGGYSLYGEVEEVEKIENLNLLPISISKNKIIKYDTEIDTLITNDMIN